MFDVEAYNKDFHKYPGMPLKDEWIEISDEMKVHTRGNVPEKLLNERRPNEDQEILDYRTTIYQPITKGPINRSVNKLFRIFMNSNFSLKVSDDLQKYLDSKIFNNRNFLEFFYGNVIKRMIEDPNGWLAWIPEGEGLENVTEKVDVLPELIDSSKIWFFNDEIFTWYEHREERALPERFWSLTKEGYYLHEKEGDFYILYVLYKHKLKEVPALILGGILREDGVYESFFNGFLPFGNEAIRQYSDAQAVNVTSAFPYRTEEYTECDYHKCKGKGWWEEPCKGEGCKPKIVDCKHCSGTGNKPNSSPYGTRIRKEPGPGEELNTRPMIEFTSPARDILEFCNELPMKLLTEARKAIFDDMVLEPQSGIAKIIDREDSHAFFSAISDNIYDHLFLNSLIFINSYRNIKTKEKPEMIKPTSFFIKTEQDLVEELGVLLEKKAPLPFVLETVRDLAKKRFSSNKTASKIIDFLMVYDPLFALGPEEKNMLIATNVIDDQTRRKNINSYQILNMLLLKDPELFEKDYDKIAELMDTEIEKLAVEKQPLFNE